MLSRSRVLRWPGRMVGLLVSTVVTCAVGALLPAAAGLTLFVGGLTVLALLLAGKAEAPTVRVLVGAREPTARELGALRPTLALLTQRGLLPPEIDLLVRRQSPTVQTGATGRRTVLISEGLATACTHGTLTPKTAAALMAHAIARIRLGQTRLALAAEFWMLPWRLLQNLGRAVARPITWFPLTRLTWRLRGLLGLVALLEASGRDHPWCGVLAANVIALSYLVPWCERRADRAAESEADAVVMQVGLGPQLAAFLSQGRPAAPVRARARRLRGDQSGLPHPVNVPA